MLAKRHHRSWFLILLLSLAGFASPVHAIQFNAYWQYSQNGAGNAPTQRDYQQRYSMGVGPALTYRPTNAITASAELSYTRRQFDAGNGMRSSDNLIPSAQVNLANDIFVSRLSGSSTIRSNSTGSGKSSRSWNATLASNWAIPLIPTLRYSHGESTSFRDISLFSNDPGTKSKSTVMSLSWDLILAQFYYQYNKSQSEDLGSNSVSEGAAHFARIQSNGAFWDKRIRYNFAQQFNHFVQDVSIGVPEGESFDFPLHGETLAVNTDPVTLPDPLPGEEWSDEDVGLELNGALADNILDTSALETPPDQRMHFGVSFDFAEQIDLMRLTLDTPLTAAQATALQWDLYIRNSFDTGWELSATNIPVTFDADTKQFVLTINRTDTQIMVVAVNQTGIPLVFTELEVFSLLTHNFSRTNTSYLTQLNLGYRIMRNLRASGSLTLDHSENESGGNTFEVNRQTVHGNIRWSPVPFVTPSFSFSENREGQTDVEEKISRSYAIAVSTIPLPTMKISFGSTLNQRYIGEQQIFTRTNYGFSAKARIYPDLSASWDLGYSKSENFETEELTKSTKSFSSNLKLKARLHPKVGADLATSYIATEKETASNRFADARISLTYRPSDILSLRGSYTTGFLDNTRPASLALGLQLTLLHTPKTRLECIVNHHQASTTGESIYLNGSWNISHNLALTTRANYVISNVNSYRFVTGLTLKL